jgi:hypothetical protein
LTQATARRFLVIPPKIGPCQVLWTYCLAAIMAHNLTRELQMQAHRRKARPLHRPRHHHPRHPPPSPPPRDRQRNNCRTCLEGMQRERGRESFSANDHPHGRLFARKRLPTPSVKRDSNSFADPRRLRRPLHVLRARETLESLRTPGPRDLPQPASTHAPPGHPNQPPVPASTGARIPPTPLATLRTRLPAIGPDPQGSKPKTTPRRLPAGITVVASDHAPHQLGLRGVVQHVFRVGLTNHAAKCLPPY